MGPDGMLLKAMSLASSVLLVASCSTPKVPEANAGPDGTIAYEVLVESNEPGVRIEANEEYMGTTPLTLTVYGDRDGTFHNFGSPHYVIRALPSGPGQYEQTKIFRTGGWFAAEDMIPKRLFFDMSRPRSEGTPTLPPRY